MAFLVNCIKASILFVVSVLILLLCAYWNDIGKKFKSPVNIQANQKKVISKFERRPSFLVIDLDGNSIVETRKEDLSVHFDYDNNGFSESTGWVGKNDGLLVRDINGNGQIDNGMELLGNNTIVSSGKKAANGFEALKDLDSNHDGVFDNSDIAWNEVKVWKDSNQNGVVDENELQALDQAGVRGINLSYETSDKTDINNNSHKQTGTFIKADGATGVIHNVWFAVNKAFTIKKEKITIPDAIKTLPEIEGFGNVRSLQETMALDTSGILKTLVEQYVNEMNSPARRKMIDNIIFHWTGVQDIDPESRKPKDSTDNPIGDARYLEAVERFLGEKYVNQWWIGREESNPRPQAAMYLRKAFGQLSEYVHNKLEEQTHCKIFLEQIKFSWNNKSNHWDVDVSQAVNRLEAIYAEDPANALDILRTLESITKQKGVISADINTAFQNAAANVNSDLQLNLQNFGTMAKNIKKL